MKKLFSLILAFVMLFSLTACKNEDSSKDSQKESAAVQNAEPRPFLALYSGLRNTLVNFNTFGCGDTSVRLQVDEDFLAFITDTAGIPESVDFSFVKDLQVDCSLNYKDGNIAISAVPVIGGKDVLTLELLASVAQNGMWMRIPELSSKYVEQTDVFQTGSYYSDFVSSVDSLLTLANCLPETQVAERLINKYSTLALETLDAEKKTETVTVEGVSQELTVYERGITETDAINVLIAMIKAAKEDTDIEAFCDDFSQWMHEYAGDPSDLHELHMAALDERLEQLESFAENADPSEIVHIAVYTRGDGSFAGICLESWDVAVFELYTVQDGENFAVSLILPNDDGSITGKGTEKGGIVNGSFQLEISGQELASMKIKDLDTVNLSKGTLVVTPSKALLTAAAASLLKDPALELSFSGAEGNVNLSLALLLDGSDALRLSLKHTPKAPTKVTLPSNGISMDQWTQEVDPEELIELLDDAGIPIKALMGVTTQKQEAVATR